MISIIVKVIISIEGDHQRQGEAETASGTVAGDAQDTLAETASKVPLVTMAMDARLDEGRGGTWETIVTKLSVKLRVAKL